MTDVRETAIVIDDDPAIREALGSLLRSVGFDVKLLSSVDDFLKSERPHGPTCLVLDVRLPGQSGLEFQRELSRRNIQLPIVFITGHGDIPMSVQAMKGGAIEFLTKPFREQDLLDAVHVGLARDRAWIENEKALATLRANFESLTPREREVMALVVIGRLNKQIAADLGVSEITVKVHRSQVMQKMRAKSLPELALMADKLKLGPGKPQGS
ncbi:response regulator nodulation protein NodW 2 [Rhizobium etli 8C-3]|uniref:LuxR family two component transcriptional regulator n=2 Tax=Rhizobium TaxID=379 RepID=A0A4R3RCA0_9HYPH|nr:MULTISPECIES: response regulator transcription factor [Rhizobium]APO76418.1 response regulator nodulation protein NodW 2 [Rhizobium etli 8C-3]TCU17824.1 LuxR family two component transcriptional regulator [Rhizobium azibense]TCU31927.1 LuxR family two component transcriptional regulator [Rhizobium azibense]